MKTYRPGDEYEYAHYKIDGHFLRVTRDVVGHFHCYTSHPTDLTEQVLRHVVTPRMLEGVPNNAAMLGELWVPGKKAEYVKTAIKNIDKRLRWDCFAIESLLPERSLPYTQAIATQWGVPFLPFLRAMVDTEGLTRVTVLPQYQNFPIEGYVFKNGNMEDWTKWKPIKTIDLVVTGFRDGRGKNLGLLGSLECSIPPFVIANVGGMNDMTRAEVSLEPEKYLGRVCEVRYQRIGTKGRLRHPAFVQWRDNKQPSECRMDQDPELEAHYKAF